ncbi:MAG TPA: DUF5710 domain-containing protein [Rickettsia endosymbiont of Bembidion lapponicum]|nr:DUF5710 domain-containing protein [Rickettsia endosymbiont of Bembidion lapponicum]
MAIEIIKFVFSLCTLFIGLCFIFIDFLFFLCRVLIKCCTILFRKYKNQQIYLNVPYHEKDQVKHLGAKWDSVKKKWFIPRGINSELFTKWLPSTSTFFNFKAPYFYLAQTQCECFKCGKQTKINAIVLPENFEALEDEEDDGCIFFKSEDYFSILSYIKNISSNAYSEILKYTNNYAINYSAAVGTHYFMSTCQNCGIVQGDNYSIQKSNAPFSPSEVEDFSKITFYKILTPIMLEADTWSAGYPPIEYYLGDYSVDGMMYVTNIINRTAY